MWSGVKRNARFAIAAAALISASACGAVDEAREPAAQAPTTAADDDPTDLEREDLEADSTDEWTWSVSWFTFQLAAEGKPESPSLVESLLVFSRARRETDALPPGVFDSSLTDDPEHENYAGQQRPGESRLALVEAGSRNVDVYLVPTTKEHVCRYSVDREEEPRASSKDCVGGLFQDAIWESSGTAHALVVEGLVADSVTGVEVQVWGSRLEADLGENVFHLSTTLERSCPEAVEALVLHYRDGRSRVLANEPPAGAPSELPGGPRGDMECR